MNNNDYDDDFSFYNINSIVNYIKENFVQILLFILVFVIIYIVDYIYNINAILFSIQQPITQQQVTPKISKIKQSIKLPKRRGNSKKY